MSNPENNTTETVVGVDTNQQKIDKIVESLKKVEGLHKVIIRSRGWIAQDKDGKYIVGGLIPEGVNPETFAKSLEEKDINVQQCTQIKTNLSEESSSSVGN